MSARQDRGRVAIGRSSERGFTFLELLVALMILSLILSFVPGTLRLGQRIWETDRRFDNRAALGSFRRFVEQRLSEAMPLLFRAPGRGTQIEFTGRPDYLSFVAPSAAGPAGGGVYRFEIANSDDLSYPIILRQSIYRLPVTGVQILPGAKSVHRPRGGLSRVDFRYFGAAQPGGVWQWTTEWPRIDVLPDLVEISFHAAGRGAAPERMVVPLRLKPRT